MVDTLVSHNWLDDGTRALMMQQTFYDINMNLFVQVERVIEVSAKQNFAYTVRAKVYNVKPETNEPEKEEMVGTAIPMSYS